ncbi:HNH endonuclease [Aliivibrio fischeri]|uniref:HNH endonuclease n=1 Tax=Aliivibrio fischeri TaxID=668 RepID=UPI001F38B6FA|nr:HNH endonuclease [Aliivibrio fischeri]MCE4937472.1 HNH endonuclease [Aliivibrio fischeri]
MVKGKVRRTNNYSDGSDYLEIHLKKGNCGNLPFVEGERVNIDLVINDKKFQVGLRMTSKYDYAWICPDVYLHGEKFRLSNIVNSIGLCANDDVLLDYRNKQLYLYGSNELENTLDILLPEEVETDFFEGAKKSIVVNKYERNHNAKIKCIEKYGTTCVICGFNSEDIYGVDAKNIIHVHHITPISELGCEYKIDPINDLRPVCPNCHAVIHRNNSCDDIENVKLMLNKQRV